MTTVADQLLAARDLIADKERWCQGALGRDAYGVGWANTVDLANGRTVRWCAQGATWAVGASTEARWHLERAAARLYEESVEIVNDSNTLGHEAVMAVYDEAIRLAKDEGGVRWASTRAPTAAEPADSSGSAATPARAPAVSASAK